MLKGMVINLDYILEFVLLHLAFYLKKEKSDLLMQYPEIFDEYKDATEEDIANSQEQFRDLMCNDENFSAIKKIYSLCGENALVPHLVELATACVIRPDILQILTNFFGYSPCLEIVLALWDYENHEDSPSLRKQYEVAKNLLILQNSDEPYFRKTFKTDDFLYDFLNKEKSFEPKLKPYIFIKNLDETLEDLFVNQNLVEEISCAIKNPNVIQLRSDKGHGKKLLIKHACKSLGISVMFVDIKAISAKSEPVFRDLLLRIKRQALLNDHLLCFCNVTEESDLNSDILFEIIDNQPLSLKYQICILSSYDFHLIPLYKSPVTLIDLPKANRQSRTALWTNYGEKYGLTGVNWQIIGDKFKLTPHQIQKATKMLALNNKKISDIDVAKICSQVLPPSQGNIKVVKSNYTLDDLKIPPYQKELLENICSHVTYRHKVYDEWNLESKYPYGKSISALFAGGSGTGKTMAAHVLSSKLGIPLYQIDLSQIVDKYIGETEKRLEKVFDIAEQSNTILFFDEADSVFGKRSQVNEAKDKYANTQVSYILQRMEQFDGLVILSTNFKQNIDTAFLRRIRYVLEFTMPDKQTRFEIWNSVFAKETPLIDINFDFLAENFEISGGNIKNIALNAAFLASKEVSKGVSMKHILTSLRDENRKLGKNMLKTDFKEYGILFDD